ncbi:MAG: uroporphyrinogen-III C-methyltransferase [Ruminococcus sp.]|nr:uroporphyrinogen-III C-methyltransferase [Ruminococcus sp.]
MTGKVYLVGAGCGGPELLTLRGKELLESCTAVAYDALADLRILRFVPENSRKIAVGKRSGAHSVPQEQISRLLVELALSGETVVRLKGGDPFVFGRSSEEISALREAGVPYEVVPGISSCIAVPELAGIPVTSRRVSRGFRVITAATAEGEPFFERYAATEETLVFLMGLAKVGEIAQGLIRGGMSPQTPAAVISEGASPRQKTVHGSLDDIAEKAKNSSSPAIIVVGETAAFDLRAKVFTELGGVSAAVVGTESFTSRTGLLLAEKGANVTELPIVKITERSGDAGLDRAISQLSSYSALAFVSRHGVELFFRRMKALRADLRSLAGVRIAAVGSSTAAALEEHGLIPDLVPEKFTSAALGERLAAELPKGSRVLILRNENGSPELAERLNSAGILAEEIALYGTKAEADGALPEDCRFVAFGSSAGVGAFVETGYILPKNAAVICIGEETAQAARKQFGRAVAAHPHTAEGIVETIIREAKNETI